MSDELVTVPVDWEAVRLGSVMDKLVDGSHNPPPKQAAGQPMLSARNIEDSRIVLNDFRWIADDAFEREHARTRITPGDVLLTIVGTIGRAAVVPDGTTPFTLQRSVAVLRSPAVDAKFLMYQLQSPRLQQLLVAKSAGTAQKGVYLKTLSDLPLLVAPADEQRRIVAALEEHLSDLDAAVAGLERARANLVRFRETILLSAISGLTAASVPLVNLLDSLRNGISTKPDAADGLRILRISAVRPLRVDLEDVRYLSGPASKYREYLLRDDDVLFTRYNGNPALVGACGVVSALGEPTVYPDKLIRARVLAGRVNPRFLQIAMSTATSRAVIQSRVKTTAGQAGISGADLKSVPVPVPPMDEQHAVVSLVESRLTVADRTAAEIDVQLARAKRLRQSILKRAFEGRLVPQDPNDEPASVLLDRVRAGRATAPAPRSGARRAVSRRGAT